MNKKRFLTVIVVVVAAITVFTPTAFAQTKYFPGYVILINGDSLKGELKKNLKNEFDNFSKATYRKKGGVETKTYSPAKAKEYCVDGIKFVSRNIDGEQVFIKVLSEGSVNLYEAQIEVMQMNDIKVKSDFYMEKAGEAGPVKIKSGKFKKQVEEAMADDETIVKALEDKTYNYENIVELFDAYNKSAKN